MKRSSVLLAALALGLVWQLASWAVHRPILPPPLVVVQVFAVEIVGDLGLDFLVSLGRVVASMALAVVTAVPAGLALGQMPALNRVFSPVIYILYPIPKVVLVLVILLFLGISDLAKVVIIFLILFFQVLVLVRDQAAGIRPELVASVRSLGAGRRALFRFVYYPASLPAILTALRQSIGTAVAVLTSPSCSPRSAAWATTSTCTARQAAIDAPKAGQPLVSARARDVVRGRGEYSRSGR